VNDRPPAPARAVAAALSCLSALAGCASGAEPEVDDRAAALAAPPLVVNECMSGPSGWIELLNTSATAIDLARDPAACWFIDDAEGGAAPRAVTDTNVNHPDGSTTCGDAGRGARCALVAPGEHVWIGFQYFNAVTPDACRLLASARAGSACGGDYMDVGAGAAIASAAAGQCFGRLPDGAAWVAPSALASCTKAAANPACFAGAACDDGNPCTVGERFTTDCSCGGGTPLDGVSCGDGAICRAGLCAGPPPPTPPAGDAALVRLGAPDHLLLTGTVVTPDQTFEGEVLVEGDTVTCADLACDTQPGALDASIVDTNGIIFPGLIDTHNHILFDIFDETDWTPSKIYTNHNQWPNEARYKAMVDAKQYLNGEAGSPVSIGCEMEKYGELKALIAGTTSVVGAANPTNRECYGSLARTIDQTPNDLGADRIQVATLFPSAAAADSVCGNLAAGTTDAYVIHVAEGVDGSALGEFGKLDTITTTDGCLLSPKVTVVHGTALGETELGVMAAAGMSLVWSPRSNVFLYGAGSDLTKTAAIPAASRLGVNIALAPDWSIGGSQNLLDELRFADQVDNTIWGDGITPKMLAEMVTSNAARALGLEATLGSIAAGKKADLVVIGGGGADRARPYDALLGATPRDVRLVLVGGRALYGDAGLRSLGPGGGSGCEELAPCGAAKFVCVAEPAGTPGNKLGQTLADITAAITSELQSYDALDLTAFDFSPVTPLVRCAP
jgi:5-methylthioadenosine/S-adenosylhomocysteine deaminase